MQHIKTIAILAVLTGIAPPASGQDSIVSPGGLANMDGNDVSVISMGPYKAQWLYLASEFDSIPAGGALIVGHSLRADESMDTAVEDVLTQLRFTFATTFEDNLSATFDENLATNATVVFDGARTSSYPTNGPEGGPNPFGDETEFDVPFFYNPNTMGNLVVEQIIGDSVELTRKDMHNVPGKQVLLFSFDPTATHAEFVDFQKRMVTQFSICPGPRTLHRRPIVPWLRVAARLAAESMTRF